ncbi:MAG: radical SAM protein, partial [Planctomycetota bacterium]|nr:radical SAM protein [Planctomycetota bacterium]
MGSHSKISRHRVAFDDEAQEDFYAAHGHTRAPLLVQWMATLRCPLSCAHCLAAGEGDDVADMPLARALGLVDEVAGMGVGEFLVTGGEPLVREDLTAVIERLGRRGVSWSLNTAIMPTGAVRRALEEHPPHFVAVSLDGPAEVHDAFRGRPGSQAGSLEAIAFFSRLSGCEVAAGTTVTTRNFEHLPHTFHLAAQSGAASWGIHLLVPEGRAAGARNLFLSRS